MFTDIEGSTGLAHMLSPDVFATVISRHHELIRRVIVEYGGTEVSTEGDAFFAVFGDPAAAADAAIEIQRDLAEEDWPRAVQVRVRIGMHLGDAILGGDNYVGVDVHRASRIAHSAHGGQITLSDRMAAVLAPVLDESTSLTELGRFRLVGFREAEPIFQLDAKGLQSEFPPLRGVAPVSHLPEEPTPFIGRDEELSTGESLLDTTRLLTLTGTGGSGKTRLSVELARRVEERFRDGAHFVSVAAIEDPDLIPTSVLQGLGLNTAPTIDPHDHLAEYLADKHLLLVIDNLEQLLPDAANVVGRMLERASRLTVIATSRSPLRVRGERELPVPPLPVPAEEISDLDEARHYAGVRLFLDRAGAVRPDFELSPENVGTVVSLTRRLDGLPLAIELAASRMRTFTPAVILDRIGNRLLESRATDVPERQQTIVNAIGWSYDLLDQDARLVFERCSVFSGSFGLEQAERVASGDMALDVLSGLETLVENSLIQAETADGDQRFRMLIVIREYAYAALVARGESNVFGERHTSEYTELAEEAAGEILSSRQRFWLDRLALDHDNLRMAIDRAIESGDASSALRLVAALWRFWQIRGHLPEARTRAEAALRQPGGEPLERARALQALGGIRYWQGEWIDTIGLHQEALELMREHGDEADIAEAAYNLSFPVGFSGDHDAAEQLLAEVLEISSRRGDHIGVSRAYWGLGDLAAYRKDWDRELDYMLKAIAELEGQDAPFDLGWARFMTAFGYQHRDRDDEARGELLAALDIFEEVRDLSAMTLIFESLAVNALRMGETLRAAQLVGAAKRIKEDTGVEIAEVPVNQNEEVLELLRSDDVSTRSAYAEGQEMSLDEVLALARS